MATTTRRVYPRRLHLFARVGKMKRTCKHILCPGIASNSNGYCEQHQAEAPEKNDGWAKKRRSPSLRGYTSAWRSFSKRYLATHPQCAACGQPATVTDHWLIPAPIMLEQFGKFILDERYYRPLCRQCNLEKGRTIDKERVKTWKQQRQDR